MNSPPSPELGLFNQMMLTFRKIILFHFYSYTLSHLNGIYKVIKGMDPFMYKYNMDMLSF